MIAAQRKTGFDFFQTVPVSTKVDVFFLVFSEWCFLVNGAFGVLLAFLKKSENSNRITVQFFLEI